MPEHTTAARAVFLSYAREDAESVRRIADALRAFGVEVWFDMNELRGGDAWDAKIRTQIRTCTLCVPVISAATQSRGEGYFRREWKIAVERTHDMAAGVPFLLPIVIDDTGESEALVPDEFMRVQWTRLPKGVPTSQFVEQVKKLLEGKVAPVSDRRTAAGNTDAGQRPAPPRSGFPGWIWGAAAAGLVAVAVGVMTMRKPAPVAAPPAPAVAETKPAAAAPVAPKVSDKSIAVLPFANLSTEKENEFFADGVHDDVITNLAKIRDLKVISRTSVLAYRDPASRNLKKIAAELGVATVLEGSIRRVGDKVHMNAQLIDARTDEHLWADTFDGDTSDIFALQAKLAQQIASALKATLTPGERTLIERRPTGDQVAYEFFLRGRALDQGLSANSSRAQYEAVTALYGQAVARDPAFAVAHVNLSIVSGVMYWFGAIDPTPERRARAQAELEIAQRLAPDAPETRYAQGAFAYLCENNWNRALEEYGAAEASLPNDARLQYLIGLTYRRLGRLQEALARFDRSVILNPNDLTSLTTQIETMMFLRRYPQARELVGRYLLMFPDAYLLQSFRLQAQYALDGDQSAHLRSVAALPPLSGDSDGLEGRFLLAMTAGDLVAAEKVLADPRLKAIANNNGAIKEPVSLYQAGIARLQGDAVAAKRYAEAAVAAYATGHWSPRQEPLVRLGVARARVLAGATEEKVKDLKSALQEVGLRDKFFGFSSLTEVAGTFAAVGRREEALVYLRELLTGPGAVCPKELRDDPFFAGLKDDPRFEDILKLAKPL